MKNVLIIYVLFVVGVLLISSCSQTKMDYFEQGNKYAQNGNYGMALIMYNNVLNDTYFAMGMAEYKRKNYQDAIINFSHVINMSSKSPEAFLYRGYSNLALDKASEAKNDFMKAKDLGNVEASKVLKEKFTQE